MTQPIVPSSPFSASVGQTAPRISRAAQEFEAQLLTSMLDTLAPNLSLSAGEEEAAGSGDYRYLSLQALASALSSGGGLGIARVLEKYLAETKVSG